MIAIAKWSLLLMLFLLIYIFAHGLLRTLTVQHKARLRLRYVQRAKFGNRMAEWISRYNIVYRHLIELLEASSRKVGIGPFLAASSFLLLIGFTVGGFFFSIGKRGNRTFDNTGDVALCSAAYEAAQYPIEDQARVPAGR